MKYENGLLEIGFINSALFGNDVIKVDGDTFIYGTNGAGKTTSLDALGFFYCGDISVLNKKGKDYKKYYFSSVNSFIYYVYKNEDKKILLSVQAPDNESRISFRFTLIEEQNYQDVNGLFLQEDVSSILESIKSLGHTIVVKGEKAYCDVLWGTTKKKEDRVFKLADNKNWSATTSIFKSILKYENISTKNIKKILMSAVDDTSGTNINFDGAIKDLIEFNRQYDAIREWNKGKESLDSIEKAFSTMKLARREISEINKKLQHLKKYHDIKVEELKFQIPKTHDEKYGFIDERKKQLALLDEQHNQANKSLGSMETKINNIEVKYQRYKETDIESSISEQEQERSYFNILQTLKAQYEDYVKEVDNIEERFALWAEKELLDLTSKEDYKIGSSKDKLLELSNKYEQELEDTRAKYLKIVEEKGQILDVCKKEFDSKKESLKNHLSIKIDDDEKITKLKSSISLKDSDIKSLANEKYGCKKLMDEYSDLIDATDEKEEGLKEAVRKRFHTNSEEITQQIKMLSSLGEDDRTLYSYLKTNGLNIEKYASVLKDDVLLMDDFSPIETDTSNVIFDISINLDSQFFKEAPSLKDRLNFLREEFKEVKNLRDKELREISQSSIAQKKEWMNQKKIQKDFHELKVREIERLNLELLNIHGQLETEISQWEVNNTEQKLKYEHIQENAHKEMKVAEDEYTFSKENRDSAIKAVKSSKLEQEIKYKEIIKSSEKLKSEASERVKKEKEEKIKKAKQEISQSKHDQNLFQGIEKEIYILEEKLRNISEKKEWIREYEKFVSDEYVLFDIYKNDKLLIEEKIDDFKNKKNTKEQEYNTLIATVDKKLQKLQEEQKNSIKEIKDIENYVKDEEIVLQDIDFVDELLIAQSASSLIANVHKQYRENSNAQNVIQENHNKYWGSFATRGLAGKNLTDPLEVAKGLLYLRDEGWIEQYSENLAQSISMTVESISEKYSYLKEDLSVIEKLTKKVNRFIVDIEDISAISKMEIRSIARENSLVGELKKIYDFWLEYGDKMDRNLFNLDGSNQEDRGQLLLLLNNFLTEIQSSKEGDIDLDDMFDLEFGISEKGNEMVWVKNITQDLSSNGTAVIIKVAITIALLKISFVKDSSLWINVPLDEISTVAAENVSKVLEYAKKHNCNLIVATPDPKDPQLYSYVYFYEVIDNKTTEISEVVVHHIEKENAA